MKLILSWNSWNTGGNCIVYTRDVELLDGRTVSLGVSDECVVLYPHIWTNFSNWDSYEYLFIWFYNEPEPDLLVRLTTWLKDGSRKDDLVADIATIMAHLG